MGNLMKKMNEQFNLELESGYLYLAMSAYLKERDMEGFAHFMFKQAHEEFEHAMKFYNFLFEVDEKVEYTGIKKPEFKAESFTDVFKQALEHEKFISKSIRELYKLAEEEKNYEALEFLGWFIDEQVEEEDNFRGIVTRFERINESWNGLYIFDAELGKRE